ncbi:hypothetical protein A6U97_25975 [Agrobacterium tumefaciens]|uniref:helix-turn-helix domain-containing protein n=1 Tax=Agrobacterium tumefaciens TaxID=358 RepID=UPI00080FEB32|nr:hypothetical protein A6U97_25975 [Agrobacterium tumefaciens]
MQSKKNNLGVSRFSISYQNADAAEISLQYRNNLMPIGIEPVEGRGRISNSHHQLGFRDWQVWTCDTESGINLQYRDFPESNGYVIYRPFRGTMLIDVGGVRSVSPESSYFIGKVDRFFRSEMAPGRAHLAISISNSAIRRQLSEIIDDGVYTDVIFSQLLSLDSPNTFQLAKGMEFAMSCLAEDSAIISSNFYLNFFNALTSLILETVPNNFSSHIGGRTSSAIPRYVKKAIDYMEAHAAEPLTIIDVSRASGTSVRSLQNAFQQFKGTTPLNYLRNFRLRIARAKLTSSQCFTVADAARESGFTHLGRFSEAYCHAFGEYPSDTTKRLKR